MTALVAEDEKSTIHGLPKQDQPSDGGSPIDTVAKRNGLMHDEHVGAGWDLDQVAPPATQSDDKSPRVSGLSTKALSFMPDFISISTSGWAIEAGAKTSTRE